MRTLKDRIGSILTEGVGLVRTGHLEAALVKFQEAQSISPQDFPSYLLLTSLKKLLEQNQAIREGALLDLR
jgi:hypothetical protein